MRDCAFGSGGGKLAFRDQRGELLGNQAFRVSGGERLGVDQAHIEAGLCRDLSDAATHETSAGDANRLHRLVRRSHSKPYAIRRAPYYVSKRRAGARRKTTAYRAPTRR